MGLAPALASGQTPACGARDLRGPGGLPLEGLHGGGLLLGRILRTGLAERTSIDLAATALDVTLTHALLPSIGEKRGAESRSPLARRPYNPPGRPGRSPVRAECGPGVRSLAFAARPARPGRSTRAAGASCPSRKWPGMRYAQFDRLRYRYLTCKGRLVRQPRLPVSCRPVRDLSLSFPAACLALCAGFRRRKAESFSIQVAV